MMSTSRCMSTCPVAVWLLALCTSVAVMAASCAVVRFPFSGRLRVKPGHACRELGEDLAADFVRDDLGVAGLDGVDGELCDVGGVGFGDIEVPGHVGVHVADVQRGDPGPLGSQFEAKGVGQRPFGRFGGAVGAAAGNAY